MEFNFGLLLLLALITQGYTLQIPLTEPSQRFFSSSNSTEVLISRNTDQYVKTLLEKWGSTGLSVAAVRKDDSAPNGWRHEFGSYGIANADGSPITPDSVFAIASNSKLFLAMSVGLLVFNKTLAEELGEEIKWSTKIRDLIPEWGLMDEEMDRGVSLQDMLSHRTGMPRHDHSGVHRKGGVSEMVSHNVVVLLYRSDVRNHHCKRRFQRCGTFDLPPSFEKRSSTIT